MTPCPNCGSISEERYLPEDPREHPEGFGWRCGNCGLNIGPMEGRENAIAAWAMPAARKDERQKVLAEVRLIAQDWLQPTQNCIMANEFLKTLDELEAGE